MGDAVPGAARVVGEHHVGVDPARGAVHEDGGDARLDLRGQIAVVVARGDHDQAVHPAGAEGQHEFLLAPRVLGARPGEQQRAVRPRHVLDGAAERCVEGVGEVFQHQADAGGAAGAQQPSAVVAPEAEGVDRRLDPRDGVRGDTRFLVHHARDRLESDARSRGDILHGGPVAVTVLGSAGGSATVFCPVVHGGRGTQEDGGGDGV